MFKKVAPLLVASILIVFGYFMYKYVHAYDVTVSSEQLKPSGSEYKVQKGVTPIDSAIESEVSMLPAVEATRKFFGDIVHYHGVGAKVYPHSKEVDVVKIDEERETEFLSFKLEVFNTSDSPLTINPEDVTLYYHTKESKRESDRPIEYTLSKEEYNLWKNVDKAFSFGQINSKVKRSGEFFIPMSDDEMKISKVKVVVNKNPIYFYPKVK